MGVVGVWTKPASTHTIIRVWDRVIDGHCRLADDAAVVVEDAGRAARGVSERMLVDRGMERSTFCGVTQMYVGERE